MKRLVTLVTLVTALSLAGFAQTAPPPAKSHALVKVARIAVAPVVHPKRSIKQVLGSVVFVTESAVDIVHGGFAGLDQASANEAYFGPLHLFFVGADKVSGKADQYLESAEQHFFGSSN